MDTKKFNVGDFVWAKMRHFPPWPARVMEPVEGVPAKPIKSGCKDFYWLYFFGTHNYAWMEENVLSSYAANREKKISSSKTASFKDAIEEIDNVIKKLASDPNYQVDYVKFVPIKRASPQKKRTPTPNARQNIKKVNNVTPSKKRKRVEESSDDEESSSDESDELVFTTDSKQNGSKKLKMKHIKTSNLTFGFLGVGTMGSGIIKNLIAAGHRLNIWNRDQRKVKNLMTENRLNWNRTSGNAIMNDGYVNTFDSPRDVLMNSDVIFSCLSDPETELINIKTYFGIDDASDNILEGKGYVTLTSIDPETSKDISEMISNKGGRYLEAQLQGSREEAEQAKLIVLAAGDMHLFMACQSCFKAMGQNAFYFGKAGFASKFNLIIQLIKGVSLVGLAEGMALADRCNILPKEFVRVFNLTNLASPYLSGKADMIVKKKFTDVEHAIQHMQKDMKLGLDLANRYKQPTVVSSTANEVFKHARRLGYDGQDAACIYMRTRH